MDLGDQGALGLLVLWQYIQIWCLACWVQLTTCPDVLHCCRTKGYQLL